MTDKPEVGEKLILVEMISDWDRKREANDSRRYYKYRWREVEVSSVGRKYFYVSKGRMESRFGINSWSNGDVNFPEWCYRSLDEFREKKRMENLNSQIFAFFRSFGKLSNGQICEIAKILNIEPQEAEFKLEEVDR